MATTRLPMHRLTIVTLNHGDKIEFLHRHCPRCGLNLAEEPPQAETDHSQPEKIEQISGKAGISRVSGDLEVDANLLLKRMVAPLTQAEKEQAERNEQRWLAGQARQCAGARQQKDREPCSHKHLVPMVKRQFFEWIAHLRRLF